MVVGSDGRGRREGSERADISIVYNIQIFYSLFLKIIQRNKKK